MGELIKNGPLNSMQLADETGITQSLLDKMVDCKRPVHSNIILTFARLFNLDEDQKNKFLKAFVNYETVQCIVRNKERRAKLAAAVAAARAEFETSNEETLNMFYPKRALNFNMEAPRARHTYNISKNSKKIFVLNN